jgi:hypothetical protein
LSVTELRFVEQRLFEERHAFATLQRALEDESDLAAAANDSLASACLNGQ